MAIRIKSTWHDSDRNVSSAKSYAEHATALAFITWRLALEGAKSINSEGFELDTDRERFAVINELLAFGVHVIDRLAHERLDDDAREALLQSTGNRLADHVQDNLDDIAGPGGYREPFIAALNDRLEDYAGLSFEQAEPGYDCLRYVGRAVLDSVGTSQTNRWIIDQVMEIEAPEIFRRLRTSLGNLLGPA